MKFEKGDYVLHTDGLYSIGRVHDLYKDSFALVDFNSTEGHFIEMVPFDKLKLRSRLNDKDMSTLSDGSKCINIYSNYYRALCVHHMNLVDPPCCCCDYGYLYSEEEIESGLCESCRNWDKDWDEED